MTFPRSIKHNPAYLSFGKSDYDILYGEGVFVGHRFYEMVDREPLFYFGHGLSYTSFEYSGLTIPSSFEPREEHEMTVAVNLRNTGSYDGAEVVQLYVSDPVCSVLRPQRELKAFAKVRIPTGETERVVLRLDKYALSFWSEEHKQWKAESGTYDVIIARSSDPRDEILRGHFELPETFFWSGL